MRPLQNDDVQDELNSPKRKFRWIHIPTGKIVRAETKGRAVVALKKSYHINPLRIDVRQARMTE